uniref:Reverse transcriptase Ty1/copia-type domain-containing protein n=1 Tax=Tanacetum cinerariifolium TaxID=118510 RepID=A0A699GT84_TANCI|nr:hypothetical protein CTI12_AA233370 [Tanacetum cinerariifolium]
MNGDSFMIIYPLYIASSDHPGMVLTITHFNRSKFHGWNRNVRMTLGAKLKLGFIDGFCPKPGVEDVDLQRWIRCDYMVTCWIMNSMVAELSNVFLYQIEKHKQVTNHSFEPTAFFSNLNNKGSNGGRKCNRGSRNDGRNDGKRFFTGCNQEGHTVDQCFKKIRYPDWYKGKKGKKQSRMAATASSRFDDHISVDTPFDMGNENETWTNLGGEEFTAALVYVDDMLITGNTEAEINALKHSLDQKFTIKDLGLAKYFLRIELCKTDTDKVQEGFLHTTFIPTHLQLADVMTKALGQVQHNFLVDKLRLKEALT